jgi:hypothetical protein
MVTSGGFVGVNLGSDMAVSLLGLFVDALCEPRDNSVPDNHSRFSDLRIGGPVAKDVINVGEDVSNLGGREKLASD